MLLQARIDLHAQVTDNSDNKATLWLFSAVNSRHTLTENAMSWRGDLFTDKVTHYSSN